MKFHLTAFLMNLVLIFSVMYLYAFICKTIDPMILFRVETNLEACFIFLMLIFSWASTFIIYKIKNQSTHFYYFVCFNLLGVIIFEIYKYISYINNNDIQFELYGLFINTKDIIPETLIPIIIISILVSISQNYIGKKLLPERYC